MTLLGALAAWTDRVRLVTTVVVPQLHDPVMLAKALATGDMLSGGRLTVGLGVGGRREDYRRRRRRPRDPDDARYGRPRRGDEAGMGRREGDRLRRPGRAGAAADGRTATAGRHDGPQDRAQSPRRGPTAWPGTTLDLDTAKQNELFDVARDGVGAGGQAQTRFWPPRSGSRSATATTRAHRCTGTCAAT